MNGNVRIGDDGRYLQVVPFTVSGQRPMGCAMALDLEHPAYLTVLALAYLRSGNLEKALVMQRQALESPKFPLGYREEATAQLREYERALAAQKH